MQLSLQEITTANWQACIHLQLSDQQSLQVASNLYSLAEAFVQPALQPRAIYAGELMIGFVMTLYSPADQSYWIPRFMIDTRHQGQGYGQRAMQTIVDSLKSERPEASILISLTPGNQAARHLYLKAGFQETGLHSHGEDILRYT